MVTILVPPCLKCSCQVPLEGKVFDLGAVDTEDGAQEVHHSLTAVF